MKLTIILMSIFVSIIMNMMVPESEAAISINLDPDDLDLISDFFREIIQINDPIYSDVPTPTRCVTKVMKFIVNELLSMSRLIRIVIALVGSNLISSHLMPDATPVYPSSIGVQPIKMIENHLNLSLRVEMCQIDFGCRDKVCWRRCHSNTEYPFLWCHTHPNLNAREYYSCEDTDDCFLCWECIEPCHE